MLPDRVFYPLAVAAALALVGLAMVWPQGQGALSPPPFRHPLERPPPAISPALRATEALQ
jgi:hypothetical protein